MAIRLRATPAPIVPQFETVCRLWPASSRNRRIFARAAFNSASASCTFFRHDEVNIRCFFCCVRFLSRLVLAPPKSQRSIRPEQHHPWQSTSAAGTPRCLLRCAIDCRNGRRPRVGEIPRGRTPRKRSQCDRRGLARSPDQFHRCVRPQHANHPRLVQVSLSPPHTKTAKTTWLVDQFLPPFFARLSLAFVDHLQHLIPTLFRSLLLLQRINPKEDSRSLIPDGKYFSHSVQIRRRSMQSANLFYVTPNEIITDDIAVDLENVAQPAALLFLVTRNIVGCGQLQRLLLIHSCPRRRAQAWALVPDASLPRARLCR